MNGRLIPFSLAVVLTSGNASAQSLNGLWDGTVKYNDYRISFPIEFSQKGADVTGSFFNGDDRVTSTSGRLAGDALTLNFDHYATRLTATVANGVVTGTYGNTRYGYHDFEARIHQPVAASDNHAPKIAGVWDIPTESPKDEHAWRLIIQQNGAHASAAILRVDGDTGALRGEFHDGKFILNHFDGARASVMKITPGADGTLDVALRGFHNPTKTFKAIRLQDAKAKGLPEPADPDDFTRVKNPNEPFQFSLPDLSGNVIANTDPRFRDKVILVNITGSW